MKKIWESLSQHYLLGFERVFRDVMLQLLESTSWLESEKNAKPNFRSARGFEVVEEIKKAVDEACGEPLFLALTYWLLLPETQWLH